VFRDDPTVNEFESKIASLTNKEAAVFCPTGTMTNEIGLSLHLSPLTEVICDSRAHILKHEVGGISYHTRASVAPITPKNGRYLTVEDIEPRIVVDHHLYHENLTKLIELENTIGGMVHPLEEIRRISSLAKRYNLKMHLDGARLFNASIATGHPLSFFCDCFDTVSLCFSKGLGAPIGSVLVGSRQDIERARHFRKLFGGGWRQAGILAAAALYALEHNFPNLKNDHDNARLLGDELSRIGFNLTQSVETNMVWADSSKLGVSFPELAVYLKDKHAITIYSHPSTPYTTRLVTHLQISQDTIRRLVQGVKEFISSRAANNTPATKSDQS